MKHDFNENTYFPLKLKLFKKQQPENRNETESEPPCRKEYGRNSVFHITLFLWNTFEIETKIQSPFQTLYDQKI